MGVLEDAWNAFYDAVSGAATFVYDTVVGAVSAIRDTLQLEYFWLVTSAALLITAAAGTIQAVQYTLASEVMAPYTVNLSTLTLVKMSVTTYVTAVKVLLGSVLTAIHFNTVIAVHSIAYLVSEDYRRSMAQVYQELSRASVALGYYPQFLALAFQNSRTLVLDASTMMGARYDMAQVEWLSVFSEYLEHFNRNAIKYQANPEVFMHDLAQLVDKPAMDAKGSFVANLILTVDHLATAAEQIVINVDTLRGDLDKLISDLPQRWQDWIGPEIPKFLTEIDNAIAVLATPRIEALLSITKGLRTSLNLLEKREFDIRVRLQRPADYLLEIDKMDHYGKRDQEWKIAELATRQDRKSREVILKDLEPTAKALEDSARRVYIPPSPAAWFVPEVGEPVTRPIEAIGREDTWFVGDY